MTRTLSPAAQIAAGLSPRADLVRRACDALASLQGDEFESWLKRSGCYLACEHITQADWIALYKYDRDVVEAMRARRDSK